MSIYNNIDKLLKSNHTSRRKLAIAIGLAPSTFQTIMQRKSGLTIETAKK